MAKIRMATPEEEAALILAFAAKWHLGKEDCEGVAIYIREDYITGGPGYAGPVAIFHWDGSPEYVDVAIKRNNGEWQVLEDDR